MDFNGKQSGWSSWLKGFVFAFSGIVIALRTERNLKFHFATGIIVLILALVFQISYMEILILLVVIGIVISLEMVNSAIEHTVNLAMEERHPLAKLAKDIAAGAVLIFSFIAAIIGILIFLHHV
ncbi:MAG TPA: diacylglycerol kinase family protein [Bacillales bacterium]|nr:diacylglycerol kinase family protein [Bacillales bacterium]